MSDISLAFPSSPKRKRDLTDTMGRGASPLRLRMDLDQMETERGEGEGEGEGRISDELRDMHLQPPAPVPAPGTANASVPTTMQRLSFRGKIAPSTIPHAPSALAHSLSEEMMEPSSPSASEPTSQPGGHLLVSAPPRTPPLNPTKMSPFDTPRTISPLPSISDLAGAAAVAAATANLTADAAHPSEPRLATPPLSASSSSTDTTPSKRAAARNRSPPPTALSSDLVWTAAEITGHNPDDPNDDGYGINGIGFRPTSAVAQQRALRRRQQVAEWKTREAREARSRRAERRRSAGLSVSRALDQVEGWKANSRRRVRFVEG